MADTLGMVGPKLFAPAIRKLKPITRRQWHIAVERAKFAANKKYYRRECYRRYGTNCLRCLKVFHRVRFADQINHVISLYNFGKTEDDNHQPICGECNLWKWTKNIDYQT